MKHVKADVKFEGCKPELVDGMLIAQTTLLKFGYTLVITAGSDGQHKEGSLHYRGYAFDLRTRDMRVQDIPTVVRDLRLYLAKDWQVVHEKDHIHAEYDPQKDGGLTLP